MASVDTEASLQHDVENSVETAVDTAAVVVVVVEGKTEVAAEELLSDCTEEKSCS